jgi:hypothetical protein
LLRNLYDLRFVRRTREEKRFAEYSKKGGGMRTEVCTPAVYVFFDRTMGFRIPTLSIGIRWDPFNGHGKQKG